MTSSSHTQQSIKHLQLSERDCLRKAQLSAAAHYAATDSAWHFADEASGKCSPIIGSNATVLSHSWTYTTRIYPSLEFEDTPFLAPPISASC